MLSSFVLVTLLCTLFVAGSNPPASHGATAAVDCAMRTVAYDAALRHPAASRHAASIHSSLGLTACNGTSHRAYPAVVPAEPSPCLDGRHWSNCEPSTSSSTARTVLFVDCNAGNDQHLGSKTQPFRTIERAQIAARVSGAGTLVFLRGGSCYLKRTLLFTAADSGVHWSSYAGEQVTVSGGVQLAALHWARWNPSDSKPILVADLPPDADAAAIDQLFRLPANGTAMSAGAR